MTKDGDYISLVKVVGKKITDITGYITKEFGEPTFQLFAIEFEDGTDLWVEGEHDMPYVYEYGSKTPKGFNENIEEIWKTDPDNEEIE